MALKYIVKIRAPLEHVQELEKNFGYGLNDIRSMQGVSYITTHDACNSIEAWGTIEVEGTNSGLVSATQSVFNRLETISKLKLENNANVARINDLSLKFENFKRKVAKKFRIKEKEIQHYREQISEGSSATTRVAIPFDSPATTDSETSESDTASDSSSFAEFTEEKQVLYDKKLRKRQGNARSGLSSKHMKNLLAQFLSGCPESPDGVLTTISEARIAFIKFVKVKNSCFRALKNTHGLKQQMEAHLRRDWSHLVVDAVDGLGLKIVVEWPQ